MGFAAAIFRAWVYPRACGGTSALTYGFGVEEGLSPRMRGNQADGRPAHEGKGSIPAHAGEPHRSNPDKSRVRVYPRACGGTCHNVPYT